MDSQDLLDGPGGFLAYCTLAVAAVAGVALAAFLASTVRVLCRGPWVRQAAAGAIIVAGVGLVAVSLTCVVPGPHRSPKMPTSDFFDVPEVAAAITALYQAEGRAYAAAEAEAAAKVAARPPWAGYWPAGLAVGVVLAGLGVYLLVYGAAQDVARVIAAVDPIPPATEDEDEGEPEDDEDEEETPADPWAEPLPGWALTVIGLPFHPPWLVTHVGPAGQVQSPAAGETLPDPFLALFHPPAPADQKGP